ncbi:hypothetical protein AN958_00444 [Leucoagaricus sp. SymC.cos]|nr:hypothetical protein AN958_00444 [Leucoagaricus sp. SymC.cos]
MIAGTIAVIGLFRIPRLFQWGGLSPLFLPCIRFRDLAIHTVIAAYNWPPIIHPNDPLMQTDARAMVPSLNVVLSSVELGLFELPSKAAKDLVFDHTAITPIPIHSDILTTTAVKVSESATTIALCDAPTETEDPEPAPQVTPLFHLPTPRRMLIGSKTLSYKWTALTERRKRSEVLLDLCVDWGGDEDLRVSVTGSELGNDSGVDTTIITTVTNSFKVALGNALALLVVSQIKDMAEEVEESKYVFFWKVDQENGYMSQWYLSPFKADIEMDGKSETCEFLTAEHWMMVQKALLFGDTAIAREILATPAGSKNMAVVKALGRKVKNFDDETWVQQRYGIVVEGNRHKFRANPELREKLEKTKNKEIVEASPLDRVWGVGFGAKNAALKREKWGLNLLGKALLEPRRSPVPVTPSLSSASASSSAALHPPPTPHTAQPPPAQPSETKLVNGNTHVPTPKPAPVAEPPKPALVNVWDRRREELAARQASSQKSTAPQTQSSASTSRSTTIVSSPPSHENLSVSGDPPPAVETTGQPSSSPAADDDEDDDPFVVRTSRAPRPHVPVTPAILSTESPEDWPEVGNVFTSSSFARPITDDPLIGGATKRTSLPLLAPAETQPQPRRDPQATKGSRQSANTSRAPSNHGQGRNSRNQSGRNSANHSANQSRIHSNTGSAQSSPRNLRSRRLPAEESNSSGPTARSPSHVNPSQDPSFPPSDNPSHSSSHSGYLSPPQQGPSPYYPQQPPPVSSPVYRSPSHGPHLGLPSDPSLPMPPPVPTYPYVYPNPYVPYDYIPPTSYPYWNGHHSHPGSGTHSPAYPPSATPSNYAAALPMHVQQHFYPPPQQMQSQPSTQSHSLSSSVSGARNLVSSTAGSTSERGSVGKTSATSSPGVTTSSVAIPPTEDVEPKINGDVQKSASVVFGSIDSLESTTSPSTSTVEGDSLEKAFKSIAIGVDSTQVVPKHRKPTRPAQKNEKDDDTKVVNGDIGVDPAIAKEAGSTGEMKWKFGNEGLASPAGGVVADLGTTLQITENLDPTHRSLPVMDEGLGDDFKVKNFGYGFGTTVSVDAPKDDLESTPKEKTTGEGDERPPTTEFQPQQGPNTGRPRGRGGFNNGGYSFDRGYGGSRRGRIMNGYNRGMSRGYSGGGRGNNHHHNNSYQRQGPPPPFNVTPPPPFQPLPPPPPHLDPSYYAPLPPPPQSAPLATYISTGFEPYPPPPPPRHSVSHSASHGPLPSASTSSPSPATGHGHAAPPLPMPLSQIGFPLDSTRFYLLGQLEYYLSTQNMAQDYFLRQRVRSCLSLWERFVLPDAPKSTVENEEGYSSSIPQHQHPLPSNNMYTPSGEEVDMTSGVPGVPQPQTHRHHSGGAGEGEGDEEIEVDEEDEEDDVVFVMGQNGGEGMWSHEKRT